MIKRFMNDDILGRVQKLSPVADELGLTMAQLAVAWVLQNDNVSAAIVGASRPEQVVENVKAAGVQIPAELMKQIDDVLGDTRGARPRQDHGERTGVPPGLTGAGRLSLPLRRRPLSRGGGSRNRRICMLRIRA